MKIVATADIHCDLIRTPQAEADFDDMLTRLAGEQADVLILAGDTVGLGWAKLGDCLERLRPLAAERCLVFGNHDYWCVDLPTAEHLDRLAPIVSEAGFHLLDRGPKLIGGIGFAGNCAWYDYSLATGSLPEDVYEQKFYKGLVWNDVRFVRLGTSDKEYAARLVEQLEADIRALERQTERIVVVTHHVAFGEMAPPGGDDSRKDFTNAFAGNRRLGEMLCEHPAVKIHLCGHTHAAGRVRKGGLLSLNVGATYRHKEYVSVDM
ncbi:MAG: metallophosphoesterase [Kiritimatiellae bacterium]|nr:metallophosphoesterase [Kiritimatiellia bacterium]